MLVFTLVRIQPLVFFWRTKTEKVEKSEGDVKMESKEEDSSMDSDADEDEEGDGEIKEDAEVRDVRYNLELLRLRIESKTCFSFFCI